MTFLSVLCSVFVKNDFNKIKLFLNLVTELKVTQVYSIHLNVLQRLQEMEESYLPPPFSIIHFIVGHIIDKKEAKRLQRDQAQQQYNKRSDTVIRSAVIDCLEVIADYMST